MPIFAHFLKVLVQCCGTSLNIRQLSPRWIVDSIVCGYFAAPCFSCTLKQGGRKTGVRFFQDPGRVLTQVPLVTVQPPANYCTKDKRGSYSLHLLYSGLLAALSLMPSSLICLKQSVTKYPTNTLCFVLVGKGNSLDLVTRTWILVKLLSRFESVQLS